MKTRWRVPLFLSAALILAQLAHIDPLTDVVHGTTPPDVRLTWPLTHVLLAPFTLTADWLNGGSRWDLETFFLWLLVGYVLVRLTRRGAEAQTRRLRTEVLSAACVLISCVLFVWWGARWNRPIPRLVASDSGLMVLDVHSHTSMSHDGRKGFGAAQNAWWHARAGFDAAFVTDHNVVGASRQWRIEGAGRPPRLLPGEELSLSGLHMVVLGTDALIDNKPWGGTFDSTLLLLDSLARLGSATGAGPYVIASLPEFWEHHWGADIGRIVDAGVRGFEVWTTSPKGMDFPPEARSTLIARATSAHLALFGATDMHGLGNTASVWNVVRLPGWRRLSDSSLTRALIGKLRGAPEDTRVIAMRRAQPTSRFGQAVAAPLGIVTAVRAASRGHALSLLLWIWVPALIARVRKR
ncbi:MAG: PHP domain-containing protein [Gemmatimonadales bacterium]